MFFFFKQQTTAGIDQQFQLLSLSRKICIYLFRKTCQQQHDFIDYMINKSQKVISTVQAN